MHDSLPGETRLPPYPTPRLPATPVPIWASPAHLIPFSPWVRVPVKGQRCPRRARGVLFPAPSRRRRQGNHDASSNLHLGARLIPAPQPMPFHVRAQWGSHPWTGH